MRSRTLVLPCALLGLLACGRAPEAAAASTASAAGAMAAVAPAAAEPAEAPAAGGAGQKESTGDMILGDIIPADLSPGDGTARMVARLAETLRRVDPELDRSLNGQRAEMFEQRLKAAEAAGKPGQQARYLAASEMIGAGRSQEAIDQLDIVLKNIDAKGAEGKAKFRSTVVQSLAIGWLRVGEQSNCILHHGTESCIAPITEAGRHADPTGSTKAIEVLKQILAEQPDDYTSRWLLNIAAMTVGQWPDGVPKEFLVPPSAFASEQDIGRFHDVAKVAGLADRGLAGGVCEEDFDGDGLLDLVTSDWNLEHAMQYYRNDGDGHFTDRSVEAGLSKLTGGLNMLHADVDNDGDADIFVPRGAWKAEYDERQPPSLLINDGHGTFHDATEAAGLLCWLDSQTAAFADYDGDGWLDLFVGTECLPKHLNPCHLFHNNKDGTFTDVAATAGLAVTSYVKGSNWGDYDNDGDPDLAITRMNDTPMLFRNDGGHFTNVAKESGIEGPPQSFPCWWFDYDNDGNLDLYLSGYRIENTADVCKDYLGLPNDGVTPRVYHNKGNGQFEDATAALGILKVTPAMGANHGDLDNDGWEDFYLATGEPDLRGIYPNRMFRNDEGKRFVDVTTSTGTGHLQKGHAVAFGDLDNDGDQDVFVVMGGALSGDDFHRALFENPGHPQNHWVTLLLQGTTSNRSAIGARIKVTVKRPDGSTRDIWQLVGTGGSFGSESLQAEIGLGDATAIEAVEVTWPGHGKQVFRDVPMERSWRLIEGTAAPVAIERKAFKLGG